MLNPTTQPLKKIFFCTCLYFLVFINASGQTSVSKKIDSLEKWMAKHPQKDTTWINNLIDLEKLYINSRSSKKGKMLAAIIQQSKKINHKKGIGRGLRFLAYQYADEGDYPSALKLALERLMFEEKNKNVIEIIDSYNSLIYIHARSNDNKKALEYALLAKKQIEILPKTHPNWIIQLGNVYTGLGNLYMINGEFEKALQTYSEVLKNISKAVKQKGTPLDNLNYLEGSTYVNLAFLYYRIEKYDLSAFYAKKALALTEKYNVQLLLPPVFNILILSYTNLGQYKEAEHYLEMISEFNVNNKLQKEEALGYYKVGRDLYLRQKKYQQAYDFQEKYMMLKDSLQGKDVQQQLNDLSVKYETDKKEQQNKLLQKEKDAVEKQNQLYLAAIVVFVGLLLLVGILYRQVFLSRKTILAINTALETANQTKDELFRIIAHDLKTPANTFVQLTQLTSHLIKTKNYKRLAEVSQKAEFLANDLQTTTNNLMYWAMLKKGSFKNFEADVYLADVFEELKEAFATYADLNAIDLDMTLDDPNLNIHWNRMVLLTILRNLLSNALKFTPQNCKVSIIAKQNEKNQTSIDIEDAGSGFTDIQIQNFNLNQKLESSAGIRGEQGSGIGLSICQELIAQFGGRIKIDKSQKLGGAWIQIIL